MSENEPFKHLGYESLYPLFAFSLATLTLVCGLSIVFVDKFSEIAMHLAKLRPASYLASYYDDKELLAALGYDGYAKSFYALRVIGIYLYAAFSIISLVSIVFFSNYARDIRGFTVLRLFFSWIVMLFFLYWTIINQDFYSVWDQDFSGILRPPMGTFIYGIFILVVSIGIPCLVAITYRWIVVCFEKGGLNSG